MKMRRLLPNMLVIFSLLAVAYGVNWLMRAKQSAQEIIGFAHVVDGDSLRIEGINIRIWGIDAPEFTQKCQKDGQTIKCGRDAARHLAGLISGRSVKCTIKDIDIYKRKVSICFVETMDLGQAMVLSGHAISYNGYKKEEAEARTNLKGVWATQFERPRDYRAKLTLQ
jgi:endonuclease YncB( thermonuclease family)